MDKRIQEQQNEVGELIALIQQGSSGAFVKLSEMYEPLLNGEVSRYRDSLSTADLDDLRQGALVSLFRAAVAYDDGKGVTFGLFAKICIVNGIADTLRYISKKGSFVNYDDIAEDEQPDSGELNPQSMVLDKEQFNDMRLKIRTALSELEYQIFEMYIGGFSYAEIAKRSGKSQKTVDNALCRIKGKLKKLFKQSVL